MTAPINTTARDRVRAAAGWLVGHVTRDEACLIYGWCLDGPGNARHGWYLRHPSGSTTWLGSSIHDVEARTKVTP